jgi:hypothetical protein
MFGRGSEEEAIVSFGEHGERMNGRLMMDGRFYSTLML